MKDIELVRHKISKKMIKTEKDQIDERLGIDEALDIHL